MLAMMENFSVGAKVAGRTMSANWVISEALVTMWTKNGTVAMALSQRCAPVQEKLKLLQVLMKIWQADGSFRMPSATALVTTLALALSVTLPSLSFLES